MASEYIYVLVTDLRVSKFFVRSESKFRESDLQKIRVVLTLSLRPPVAAALLQALPIVRQGK